MLRRLLYKLKERMHRDIYAMMEWQHATLLVQLGNIDKRIVTISSAAGYATQTLNNIYSAVTNDTPKNKKAVVTVITGDYADLRTPLYATPGWDYICFTDDPALRSNFWKVVYLDNEALKDLGCVRFDTPRYVCKFMRTMVHKLLPEYTETLSVDASFLIIGNVEEYVNKFTGNADIMLVVHPYWDCIYEEAKKAIELATDDPEVITRQVKRYRNDGFPEHFGQIEGGRIYRKHTDSIRQLNEMWYKEITNGSNRDQMSFMYCCWKLGIHADICTDKAESEYWRYDSPYWIYLHHKHLNPWEVTDSDA